MIEIDSSAPVIDPRIQYLLDRRSRGLSLEATASTSQGEIAVIAKVSDLSAWSLQSEVYSGASMGKTAEGGFIVTARVPLARVEHLRKLPFVQSIKASQLIKPELSATIEETQARADLLPPQALGSQGKGVIVGIIDFGCDFVHQNFRHPNGTSRILRLWDQGAQQSLGIGQPGPYGYGKVYTCEDINVALRTADPYRSLGHNPGRGSHGTHVMDIACGNGQGSGTPGMAPQSDIIFVQISASDIPWEGEYVVGSSFGSSVQLLEAISYIFAEAGNRPCVINMSLGTNGGPHDGSSLVEQGIDAIVTAAPNRAVVLAASNSHEDRIHAAGKVPAGGMTELVWEIGQFDFTHNELEVWYSNVDTFRLELVDASEQSIGLVELGASARVLAPDGNLAFFVAHRSNDPNNGDNTIGIFMNPQALAGGLPTKLRLRLHGVAITEGSFHAWIERDDNGQSSFPAPADNTYTLGSISCGYQSIAVGSYDAHVSNQPLSWFSSEGPTRDGRQKPEISAPGHNVRAANSSTVIFSTRMSGTSMATPAVSGAIALVLAEAHSRQRDLSIQEIRKILLDTARNSPPTAGAWDPRYGTGRLDASAAVHRVIDLA
jgi:subtilisin family serine protease